MWGLLGPFKLRLVSQYAAETFPWIKNTLCPILRNQLCACWWPSNIKCFNICKQDEVRNTHVCGLATNFSQNIWSFNEKWLSMDDKWIKLITYQITIFIPIYKDPYAIVWMIRITEFRICTQFNRWRWKMLISNTCCIFKQIYSRMNTKSGSGGYSSFVRFFQSILRPDVAKLNNIQNHFVVLCL